MIVLFNFCLCINSCFKYVEIESVTTAFVVFFELEFLQFFPRHHYVFPENYPENLAFQLFIILQQFTREFCYYFCLWTKLNNFSRSGFKLWFQLQIVKCWIFKWENLSRHLGETIWSDLSLKWSVVKTRYSLG